MTDHFDHFDLSVFTSGGISAYVDNTGTPPTNTTITYTVQLHGWRWLWARVRRKPWRWEYRWEAARMTWDRDSLTAHIHPSQPPTRSVRS